MMSFIDLFFYISHAEIRNTFFMTSFLSQQRSDQPELEALAIPKIAIFRNTYPAMLSAVKVKFVRTPLRPGLTPRFSQLIHESRAVKSETGKEQNLKKAQNWINNKSLRVM